MTKTSVLPAVYSRVKVKVWHVRLVAMTPSNRELRTGESDPSKFSTVVIDTTLHKYKYISAWFALSHMRELLT